MINWINEINLDIFCCHNKQEYEIWTNCLQYAVNGQDGLFTQHHSLVKNPSEQRKSVYLTIVDEK